MDEQCYCHRNSKWNRCGGWHQRGNHAHHLHCGEWLLRYQDRYCGRPSYKHKRHTHRLRKRTDQSHRFTIWRHLEQQRYRHVYRYIVGWRCHGRGLRCCDSHIHPGRMLHHALCYGEPAASYIYASHGQYLRWRIRDVFQQSSGRNMDIQ